MSLHPSEICHKLRARVNCLSCLLPSYFLASGSELAVPLLTVELRERICERAKQAPRSEACDETPLL